MKISVSEIAMFVSNTTPLRSLIAEAMPLMGGAPEGSGLRILGGYGLRE